MTRPSQPSRKTTTITSGQDRYQVFPARNISTPKVYQFSVMICVYARLMNFIDVYVASFFSTHRPISITGPLPPDTKAEDIDKIFAIRPKSQRNKTQDVIYTLTSAVQQIEEHTSNGSQNHQATQHDESISQRADLIKALTQQNNTATGISESNNTQHLDGQPQTSLRVPGGVKIAIQALARQFRPFHPPPVPTPAPEVEFFEPKPSSTSIEASQTSSLPPLEFELQSQPEPSPTKTPQPTASKKLDSSFFTPTTFTSQRRSRRGLLPVKKLQEMTELRRIGQVKRMDLISVKRIRRLKMKKHKFKKLQRKTRNLRRRQGKI